MKNKSIKKKNNNKIVIINIIVTHNIKIYVIIAYEDKCKKI